MPCTTYKGVRTLARYETQASYRFVLSTAKSSAAVYEPTGVMGRSWVKPDMRIHSSNGRNFLEPFSFPSRPIH
jgi:hypothetical protein